MRRSPLLLLLAACSASPPAAPRAKPNQVDFDPTGGPLAPAPVPAGGFYANATYDAKVTTPDRCLGHPVGARIAPGEAIIACFRRWDDESPRVRVDRYATSHEGRELVRVIITAPENLARLDDIRRDLDRLADPRGLPAAEGDRLIAAVPGVAWFVYSIHGDETSGADAAVALGHHLAAATDADTEALLRKVIVVIDPVANPDGRARTVAQVGQTASAVANLDQDSMHRGQWPWGRGNHYLYDMNRDWFLGVAPETRGRWQALGELRPHLLVDIHEMGPQESFLSYPYSDPVNPHMAANVRDWQAVFTGDLAKAFDGFGWAYYTREWADGWYPGYSDAWASLTGGVGVLYEQARNAGQPMRRDTGEVRTYRDAVHHQAIASLSNLLTFGRNRDGVLKDYLAFRRASVQPAGVRRAFALVPGRAPDRERRLLLALLRQGIEVWRTDAELAPRGAVGALGGAAPARLPRGTYLVPAAQPNGALVRALLEFDPRMSDAFLVEERKELEQKGRSRLYDATAWDMGRAFAVDAWWIDDPQVARTQVTNLEPPATGITGGDHPYVWIIDGRDDGSVAFAARAAELGVQVRVADRAFRAAGRELPRGTVVVLRADNPAGVDAKVDAAARAAGVAALAAATGRSPDAGPDLGGNHFHLITRPRIAVLTNSPIDPAEAGAVWHELDRELGVPFTMIDAQYIGYYDLRRYSVLVVPDADDGLQAALAPHAKTLQAWVAAGGTLVGLGGSAALLTAPELGLSSVKPRSAALAELDQYAVAAKRDLDARAIKVEPGAVWDPPRPKPTPAGDQKKQDEEGRPGGAPAGSPEAQKEQEAWARRFAPRGVIARGLVAEHEWITFGLGPELPVPVAGGSYLLARSPVRAPIRLAPADRVRLGGLLWPEARERLPGTAFVAVEPSGQGQVILFATSPVARSLYRGAARVFANAVIYGPSLGAAPPLPN